MTKFDFLGNGEIHWDHVTMTVRTMSVLALSSNGKLELKGPKGDTLVCTGVKKNENVLVLLLAPGREGQLIDWGVKAQDNKNNSLLVVAQISGEDRHLPITMSRDADDGRPVVVVSAQSEL